MKMTRPTKKVERRFAPTLAGNAGGAVRLLAASATKAIQIVGYAAVFDEPSEPLRDYAHGTFREIIRPGAFKQIISQRADVLALFNHGVDNILGRVSAGTLRLAEDRHGLKYTITVPKTTLGRDLVESLKRGDIQGSSFSFNVDSDGDTWIQENGVHIRTIHQVGNVFDVGPCCSPAYGSTTADALHADSVALDDDDTDRSDAEREYDLFVHQRKQRTPIDILRRRLNLEAIR